MTKTEAIEQNKKLNKQRQEDLVTIAHLKRHIEQQDFIIQHYRNGIM